jgi:hypothetical protein
VSLALAETTVKMASLEHCLEKQTYNYLQQFKSNALALEQHFYFGNKRIVWEVVIWWDSLVDRCVPWRRQWIWTGEKVEKYTICWEGLRNQNRLQIGMNRLSFLF